MAEGNKYQSHGSRANVPPLKASEASKSNEQVQTSTAFSTSLLFHLIHRQNTGELYHPLPEPPDSCSQIIPVGPSPPTVPYEGTKISPRPLGDPEANTDAATIP
jgi:hypothetical protein